MKRVHFSSWKSLCEEALDVAFIEAQERLKEPLFKLMEEIADEIIEKAEVYEPKKHNQPQ